MIILTLTTAGRSPSSDEEEEGEDWMKEFIGTSAEPDMDAIMDTGKQDPLESSESYANQSKTLDDEDDDELFGEAAPKPERRERKKSSGRKRRVRRSKDDDEDDDEDDFGESSSKPKRRRVNRK